MDIPSVSLAPVALSTLMVEQRASCLLRLRVLASRGRLDGEIAAGESIGASPERLLRSLQLIRTNRRRAIAAVLQNIVAAAEERQADPTSLLLFESDAVNAARNGIVELIAFLRSDNEMSPQAVALASQLAFDPKGPVYDAAAATSIASVLREINATMI